MLILYKTEDAKSQVQLRAEDDTVWLSQREMAELFDVSQDNIGLHLKHLHDDEEVNHEATTEESSVVQFEGSREVCRPLTLYNLDVILAVGYRVRSPRGVQFRRWASTVLKEYLLNDPSPKGAFAYQPKATPWGLTPVHSRVLKERRISSHKGYSLEPSQCGVPSERIRLHIPIPGVSPRAGMHCPVGA